MSATLTEECRKYAQAVHKNTVESTPFFYAKGGTPYTKSTIGKFFRGILWDVGIPYKGKQFGPRNLLILSRYVGHTSISSTQYYLRLTAQSFPHIMDICEQNLGGMYAPFDLAMEREGLQDG